MTGQELSELLATLKHLNNETEFSPDVLSRTFDTCLKLTDILENSNLATNEQSYQNVVKICINSLENCTRLVNELDLFSSNETIEEIQTSSIKYLLLPGLLGNLNLSLQSKELAERYKFLETAEVYFKDFLLRCRNYELSKRPLINKYEYEVLDEINAEETVLKRQTTADLIAVRESKLEQYRLKKQLKERENELKPALERPDAEECVREYYLLVLERWMLNAVEELANIQTEKSCIGHRVHKKEKDENPTPKKREIKPLKPIIITRNEIEKKVFGLGYPSIPVMTIDDFYRQRFEKMVDEHKSSGKSLQEMAMGAGSSKEEEDIQKEMLLEKDDPMALQRERAFDDWKDDNPRGSGNRKNKG